MLATSFMHAGRIVRIQSLVGAESVLCAILDIGGDVAVVANHRFDTDVVLRHVKAHLDDGIPGCVVCLPDCAV